MRSEFVVGGVDWKETEESHSFKAVHWRSKLRVGADISYSSLPQTVSVGAGVGTEVGAGVGESVGVTTQALSAAFVGSLNMYPSWHSHWYVCEYSSTWYLR